MLGQGLLHRAPCLRLQRLVATCGEMRNRHREAAAFAAQARRIQQLRQPLAIQRGRHHHDAQVLAQLRLHIQRQCQAEIGGQMPLVEFIEQQRPHALQQRVVLQQPGQDAFGHHLDPGPRGDPALETDAIADGLSDIFAALPRHELRGAARGHATRLQHDDLPAFQPRCIQQRQRHLGGLAGAGRCFQHQPGAVLQRGQDLRQQCGNREHRGGHAARIRGPGRSGETRAPGHCGGAR